MIGFTQFSVHYYDLSSYFLELLILYVFLKGIDLRVGQTMMAMLLISRVGTTRKVDWNILGLALCSLGTYLVLRVMIDSGGPAPKAPAGGDLWAVRLYVPLVLGALFLSKMDISGAAVRLSAFRWIG